MGDELPPIAVTLGDPAGIGPEIIGKAWAARDTHGLHPFFAIGDRRAIQGVWNGPIRQIVDPAEAKQHFGEALPIIQVDDAEEIVPGQPSTPGARCALHSLEMGTGIARSGTAGALVTGPVAKAHLYSVGFTHPGQTEFIAERCGVSPANIAMMLAGPDLRTVPVTIHESLVNALAALSIELIMNRVRAAERGMVRNFGIDNPRIAIAGLNPHAGESGMLGSEEIDIVIPAIEQLRAEGLDVRGPFAADTMFHARARKNYDVAICLYHDQALIPIKTLYFDEGVNMTLGLPIVRTAPDHGTAFEIAGKGVAEPGAMIAAIRLAAQCAQVRAQRSA